MMKKEICKGEILELSKRYDSDKVYDFFLVVIECKEKPKLDFSKPVSIYQED
jgi:hypothetical protein